jgi:hypothetical protein
MTMLESFESARRVSVPIIVIRTADQFWTEERTARDHANQPLVRWDAANGITAVNDVGNKALSAAKIQAQDTVGFVDAMLAVDKLPQGAVCYAHNAQRQLQSGEPMAIAAAVQAVSNLRDRLKKNFRALVMLGPEGFAVPPELGHDVIVLDHPLPGPDELRKIVLDVYAAAKQTPPDDAKDGRPGTIDRAVDAIRGLSGFEAEQITAMSFRKSGLDHDALQDRQRVAIEQTPGLGVWRGTERFSDIIGQDALKRKLSRRINGRRPLRLVVWMDEIDKALANVEQDTSGVRMYQLLKLLTTMENRGWSGFVGVGVAGGGKSLIAKALGNEAACPTVALDLGATESKYVGESEANMLRVMSVIEGIGGDDVYFVATSNAASVMRPELQRRFTDGMWFFDLMSEAERQAAWKFYVKRYKLAQQPLPDDEGWTGAEIRNCCRDAYDLNVSLLEAAETILPMATSRANDIEALRQFANGRFLDVNRGGKYAYDPAPMAQAIRAIELPEEMKAQAIHATGRVLFDEKLPRN